MLRLDQEMAHKHQFDSLSKVEWQSLLTKRKVCSTNHDTGLCLDFPHFCSEATTGCGGPEGWCYTFQGHQSSAAHHEKVMMVDQLAAAFPGLFGDAVAKEVREACARQLLAYPNVRVSGSGEIHERHLDALVEVRSRGVHVWGFTKRLKLWTLLAEANINLIFSVDSTTSIDTVREARRLGARLSYTSLSVSDVPPEGTVVTFPLHRGGKVREVVETTTLCPKVLEDYFDNQRRPNWCQTRCHRCHLQERLEIQ